MDWHYAVIVLGALIVVVFDLWSLRGRVARLETRVRELEHQVSPPLLNCPVLFGPINPPTN